MLVTRQPIFRRFWHAVMPLSQLADGPKPFTLVGEDIVLFFALALYGVLLGLGGLIFLVSHIPPKAVNLDAVISALVFLENVLVAPRKLLLWLWPWETIPSGLIWVLTAINSLVWGAVLATLKVAWQK